MNDRDRFSAVSTALITLNLVNNCRQPIEQIKTFVNLVLPALSRYSTTTICQAIEQHSIHSPFWPKKFELIELCKVIDATQRNLQRFELARLPEPPEQSDYQEKINMEGIRMFREAMAAKKGMPNG